MAKKKWSAGLVTSARRAVNESPSLGIALDRQPYPGEDTCALWNDLVVFLWYRMEKGKPDEMALEYWSATGTSLTLTWDE